MFDWLNPNVGTYRFPFNQSGFEEDVRRQPNRAQEQMETGTDQLIHALTCLEGQEGKFADRLRERLEFQISSEQTKGLFVRNAIFLHTVTLGNTVADYHKQKYDIHTEIDQDAMDRLTERLSNRGPGLL